MKPLNPKSEPTTTGLSEMTRTVNDTLVQQSGLVSGRTQFRSLVFEGARGTVVAPVSHGYCCTGFDPGMFAPERLLPSLSSM